MRTVAVELDLVGAVEADRTHPPAILEHGDTAEEEGERGRSSLDRIGARLLGGSRVDVASLRAAV